jgi:hypothetical protein
LLRSKGFDIGSHAAAKKSDDMHQIVAVDREDTSQDSEATGPIVVLRNSLVASLILRVGLATFLAGWELRNLKTLVELNALWPANRPSSSDAFKSLCCRGVVFHGLAHLAMTADFGAEGKVVIYSKPSRKVEATGQAAERTVVLLPESTAVKMLPRGEAQPFGSAEVRFVPEAADSKCYIMPCCNAEYVAPYWCINTTVNEDDANMSYASASVTCLTGHDFFGGLLPACDRGDIPEPAAAVNPKAAAKGKAQGKPKGKAKGKANAKVVAAVEEDDVGEATDDHATQSRMIFPYLLNIKPLSKGDELLVFKAAAPQKRAAEAVQPINLTDLAKRAKAKE